MKTQREDGRSATAEDRFRRAVEDFYRAGMRLVEVWDDEDEDFHADERFPLPDSLRPPASLDEWISDFAAHYEGFATQVMSE